MLERIRLINYRNINNCDVALSPTENIIIAPNSSGKTNFLESIYYSVFRSSFKIIQSNAEIVGTENEFAKATLKWSEDELEAIISTANNQINRKFTLDGKGFPQRKVISKFPIVIFAPNSVDLISGEPGIRRSDLDDYLGMYDSNYKIHHDRYSKLLKNRNALIKQIREGKAAQKELNFWTNELVKSASIIFDFRCKFFDSIKQTIKTSVQEMEVFFKNNQFEKLDLIYIPNLDVTSTLYSEALLKKFQDNSQKEIAAGKTLYGVHKDDYAITLEGRNLRFFGSRGQQRLATFLIKVAQMHFYNDKFEKWPLLLVDDLMSELDNENRLKIGKYLERPPFQYILTSAEQFEIPDSLKAISNEISLK